MIDATAIFMVPPDRLCERRLRESFVFARLWEATLWVRRHALRDEVTYDATPEISFGHGRIDTPDHPRVLRSGASEYVEDRRDNDPSHSVLWRMSGLHAYHA